MGPVVTVSLKEYQELESYRKAFFELHRNLVSTVTNETYNDDLDVNEHEFDFQKLQEIALDHYHDC